MSFKLMSAIIPISSTTTTNRIEESNRILRQLLECVQECQKRYGGKRELATEFDSCVAGLCLSFEAVFLHGLRTKPQDNQQTTLKQVSEIVTSSLHINNDSTSFWPFVCKHLTKHEKERYEVLKHIWTDIGKGRAWIRSSLNERSLERNIHTVLSNEEILKIHYEDWAILSDQEKNSMLPNMAAGLNSILFAISIDKPELNSGITIKRADSLRGKIEPIIEAPLPELNRLRIKEKRKRRVAKQLISFDDDDSILSSSVPSSSSSITSESNSMNEANSKKSHSRHKYKVKMESTSNSTTSTSTLSSKPESDSNSLIEKSGTRDKYSNTVVEKLTPIMQTDVGELTPVSVEPNKNFDSPDVSDDMLEVPTDISAVLTAVETKNKEEIKKLQEKLVNLNKENSNLKEQLKKYVSAVQMLKSDDEEFQKALEELQIESLPDYKMEAKMFEKKLVQVAEMHAELMDFNVVLQQQLCQKDSVLERLKAELEELRGPMASDDVDEDMRGSVNIWIPSAFLTGNGSDVHHVYQIFLRAGNDEWNIYRRYAQFYALHTDLKKLDPAVSTFDFPPKKSIGRKDSALVEDRRKRLQTYMRRIIAHWPELAHCNSRYLLEQHLAFFKDTKETDQKHKKDTSGNTRKSIFSTRRSGGHRDNHYTGL